jgi:hypothetical protein
VANHAEPSYSPDKLDQARSLLATQAKAFRSALDRCEKAEKELSECRTALHWAERSIDALREAASKAAPSGAAAVSAALLGLPASSGMGRPEPEPYVKPWKGDEALTFEAIVDMSARAVLNHCSDRHSPDGGFVQAHSTTGLMVAHDSQHVLGAGIILHTHRKSERGGEDDRG